MACKGNKQLTKENLEWAFEEFKAARNAPHSRWLSWEHCFGQFATVFEDLQGGRRAAGDIDDKQIDYLSLHLAFFLASWGMMRGSTKLLQHDYKVHAPLIPVVLNYSDLYGRDLSDFSEPQTFERFAALHEDVVKHCEQFSNAKGYEASDTLVGKIMMGTLGIAPAYDKFVSTAVKKYGISYGKFSTDNFRKFAAYFTENHADITKRMTKDAQKLCPLYTRAKVIDALLWFIREETVQIKQTGHWQRSFKPHCKRCLSLPKTPKTRSFL